MFQFLIEEVRSVVEGGGRKRAQQAAFAKATGAADRADDLVKRGVRFTAPRPRKHNDPSGRKKHTRQENPNLDRPIHTYDQKPRTKERYRDFKSFKKAKASGGYTPLGGARQKQVGPKGKLPG